MVYTTFEGSVYDLHSLNKVFLFILMEMYFNNRPMGT